MTVQDPHSEGLPIEADTPRANQRGRDDGDADRPASDLEALLQKAEAEAAELKDAWLRARADVENIRRRLRENAKREHPRPIFEVVAAASQEVRSGILYATAIIILVFVPLFALAGIEGRLFAPLGIAYIVSILASLVTAVTVTPVLASYAFRRAAADERALGESWLVRRLKAIYARAYRSELGL